LGERGKGGSILSFSYFFTARSEKDKKEGCEEMNAHFFTAPFSVISG
jgi:hypothetical protein